MADTVPANNTISRTDSGFPPYLDFNKLRSDSIDYLGNLTGKLWTDYNLHDPGITTLEVLCYALLDLGYRTNFPVADIFARNPSDSSTDDNFLSPAQILTCSPLTITDYRKMLIDLDGVKNAWLEVATDLDDICKDRQIPGNVVAESFNPSSCLTFLNGLYHVYIELEDEKANPADQLLYTQQVLTTVKDALMRHRNLCEDFADIYILCKLDIGICADIELNADADPVTVYKQLITVLQDFFDPSPKFYTLPELLDKGTPIEDIYSGRPYNLTQSHGFTDTTELENLVLKKEIHLSDVYQVILNIDGIATVRRLKLQTCSGGKSTPAGGWKFMIPKNSIPVFSTDCSGIQFTQNAKAVQTDFSKYNQYLSLRFSNGGKILYQEPSTYLDPVYPVGVFRNDLADYYSIQNEFPRVYGIAEGGLPVNASDERKAQALQFKGYLLFFDQLLANYLSQLNNIRSQFSFRSPADISGDQTYFWQKPDSVPDLDKLLRFDSSSGGSGSGGMLGMPVNREKLLDLLTTGPVAAADIDALSVPYYFHAETDRDVAIALLMEDFFIGDAATTILSTTDACSYFYIGSASDDWLILSKRYADTGSMNSDLTSLQYLATVSGNYQKNLSPDGDGFSFSISSTFTGYLNFLGTIAENRDLYRERRNDFLDHLLSRFAEQFTDFALLSFGFERPDQLEDDLIKGKEQFLSQYPSLSSNRGKAFDYMGQPYTADNISGFENRVAALAGWKSCGSVSLCNFVVEEFEELFIILFKIEDDIVFTAEDKFYSKEKAEEAVQSLVHSMQKRNHYSIWHDRNADVYKLQLSYNDGKMATLEGLSFPDYAGMEKSEAGVHRLFAKEPVSGKLHVSQSVFRYIIRSETGEWFSSKKYFSDLAAAEAEKKSLGEHLTDPEYWDVLSAERPLFSQVYADFSNPEDIRLIDIQAFKIDISNTIVGKPDKFNFEILDRDNHFKLISAEEFNSFEEAQQGAHQLLMNLSSGNDPVEKNYVSIPEGRDTEREMKRYIRKQIYHISTEEKPFRYQYNFFLDDFSGQEYLFRSQEEFDDPAKAHSSVLAFYQNLQQVNTWMDNGKLQLRTNGTSPICQWVGEPGNTADQAALEKPVQRLLAIKKKITSIPLSGDPALYEEYVSNDIKNRDQKYVYRLVDKDHLLAFYISKSSEFDSVDEAIAEKKALFHNCADYAFIEICLGGDIFHSRKDEKTGAEWIHFQIKVNHPVLPAHLSVLFESVQGYASEAEAQTAFDAAYVEILNKAMKAENYGEGKYISLEKILIPALVTDTRIKSVVFVPEKTKEAIHAFSQSQLINALVEMAKKYPIRIISNAFSEQAEWGIRFPCLPIPGESLVTGENCGCDDVVNTYYYFILEDATGKETWQSVSYFTTAAETRSRFYFFLPMLCYPGNYHIHKNLCRCTGDEGKDCTCRWEIFIREVLAESRQRFVSKEMAWKAVEEFICVSQSRDSFHRYFNRHVCGESFYVACMMNGLKHPCSYTSEKKRNEELEKLFKSAKDYFGSVNPPFFSLATPDIIYDVHGHSLAQFPAVSQQNDFYCKRYMNLVAAVQGTHEFQDRPDGFYLLDASKQVIVSTPDKSIGMGKWKESLREFAYYFPVVRSTDDNGNVQFCVEIRLPHYNNPGADEAGDDPCGCGEKKLKGREDCYVAWKSVCCYPTCLEALYFYLNEISFLTDFTCYRPVFDCDCGGYRIELIPDTDIIAVNPQSYPTVKTDCDAIDRAKCLINTEGMHLVEHLLLRPRCEEDCNCDYRRVCEKETDCSFVWNNGDPEDPCNLLKKICFVPGEDPYSFIATIALPAWSKRLRKAENQIIVENLLYREAPAHVLLRILWLTPHDLCRFEGHYKKWLFYLGWDKDCHNDFSLCDFRKFLFDTSFDCLDPCTVCLPCTNTVAPPECFTDPCDELSDPDANAFLDQVNEIFCWKANACAELPVSIVVTAPVPFAPPAIEIPVVPEIKLKKVKPEAVKAPPVLLTEEDADRKIDERYTRYRNQVQTLDNDAAKGTRYKELANFLKLYQPTTEQYVTAVQAVLDNEKPKGRTGKKLTPEQQEVLISNFSYYFFDNNIFNNKKTEDDAGLTKLFKELKKEKLLPARKEWNEPELKLIRPGTDLKPVEKFIR